jgi:chromosome segregation ATPase
LNQDIATVRYDNEKHQLAIRQAEKRGHELELAVQKYREGKERAERRLVEVEESVRRVDSALEGKTSGYAVMEKQVWDLQASVEGLEDKVRLGEDEVKKVCMLCLWPGEYDYTKAAE